MRACPTLCLYLVVVLLSSVEGQEPRAETQKKLYARQRALKVARQIENADRRGRALSLIDIEAGDLDPPNLEGALTLIGLARTPSQKQKLLRKLVRESAFKSEFGRSLTANESKRIEDVLGANGRPGVTLLAMVYMDVNLEKARVANALQLLESAPPGIWRDGVYFSAIHVLLARSHVATGLQGDRLRLDAKKVPTSFVRLSQEAVKKIEHIKLRNWAAAMTAMATMKLGRGRVDKALTHIDQVSLVDLRDTIRFQAIAVLLTGKTIDDEVVEVSLSPQEVQLFTSHHE